MDLREDLRFTESSSIKVKICSVMKILAEQSGKCIIKKRNSAFTDVDEV